MFFPYSMTKFTSDWPATCATTRPNQPTPWPITSIVATAAAPNHRRQATRRQNRRRPATSLLRRRRRSSSRISSVPCARRSLCERTRYAATLASTRSKVCAVLFLYIKSSRSDDRLWKKKAVIESNFNQNDDLTFLFYILDFFVFLYLQYFCSLFDIIVSRNGKI